MMENLVLFGAGGLARETIPLIDAINAQKTTYRLLGFVVEEKYYKKNSMVGSYPMLGTEEWLLENKENVLCNCVIGTPEARARIQKDLTAKGVKFETLIDPTATIWERSSIGKGSLIARNTLVSVDCTLGDGVFMNGDAGLGHDVSIGNYTCLMGGVGVAGWCNIGEEVFIGGRAFITPKRRIGNRAKVAAGSVVFTHVKEGTTVLGNPAKRMDF